MVNLEELKHEIWKISPCSDPHLIIILQKTKGGRQNKKEIQAHEVEEPEFPSCSLAPEESIVLLFGLLLNVHSK